MAAAPPVDPKTLAPGVYARTEAQIAAEQAQAVLAPIAKSICDLVRPADEDDPAEIIGHRFLSRFGGLLFVGPTGVGKSSLTMQIMLAWALGMPCMGLVPKRKTKSLLIQSKNDEGDLAEFRDGAFAGMGLTPEQIAEIRENVIVCHCPDSAGMVFWAEVVEPLLEKHRPDILWIDPAHAFLGGNASDPTVVGQWLRRGLAPLLVKYNCASVIIHHTSKPFRGPAAAKPSNTDHAYDASGTAEWANWHRATLSLDPVGDTGGLFRLIARKRGPRLRWRDANDQPTCRKVLAHSKEEGRIWWEETDESEIENETPASKARKTVQDLMELVPISINKSTLQDEAQQAGIANKVFRVLVNLAVEDGQFHLWKVKRTNGPAAVHVARYAQPRGEAAA